METCTVLTVGAVAVAAGALVVVVKKGIRKAGAKESHEKIRKEDTSGPNLVLARKAFLNHIDDFSNLFFSLESGADVNKWTEVIITINDKDLTNLWLKCIKMQDVNKKWMQILASWQVKRDTCKSFTCLTSSNIASYTLPDGSTLLMDKKYEVVTPCWVYTFEDEDGKTIKQIISKGIVVPARESWKK